MTVGYETITPKALNVSYRSVSSTSCTRKKGGNLHIFQYRGYAYTRVSAINVCLYGSLNSDPKYIHIYRVDKEVGNVKLLTGSRFPTKRLAPTSIFLSCDAWTEMEKENKTDT